MNERLLADLIERAEDGDRTALFRLYGHASAWLIEGKAPPPLLSTWIGERLSEVSQAIQDTKTNDAARELRTRTARAMRVQREGKRGRPKSRRSALTERGLAQDVEQWLLWNPEITREEAFYQVAEYHSDRGRPFTSEQVKSAYHANRPHE